MGFTNPITGEQGALILQQIKSPGFNQVAGVGWAVMKNGNAYFYNVTATGDITATEFDGTDFVINGKGIFFYGGAPANGNLIISIAGTAGNDTFGNSYPEGLGFSLGGKSVVVGLTGGSPLEYFVSGLGSVSDGAAIQDIVQGAGTGQYEFLQILSATDSTQKDLMLASWGASSADGTQLAQLTRQYKDGTGVFHVLETVDLSGVNIKIGSIVAAHPGTGTSRANLAIAETWQTPVLGSGWAMGDVGGGYQGLQYRKQPDGSVWIFGEVHSTSTTPSATIFTLPSGYFNPTTAMGQRFPVITNSGTAPVANAILVSVAGAVSLLSNLTAANVNVVIDALIRVS